MSERQVGWAQVIVGFSILVFGVFLTKGGLEIALAVIGVLVASPGLQKIRQP